MPMKLQVGDVLQLKKKHPCGGDTFEIMRAGMDFRLKCLTCEAQIWMDRPSLEKRIKRIAQVKGE